jgi:hypothetical protein
VKSFSVDRNDNITQLIVIIILVALTSWLISLFGGMGLAVIENVTWLTIFVVPFITLIILAPLSLALWMGLLLYANLITRLVFTEHSVEKVPVTWISRFLPGAFKPFSLDYDQIKLVCKNERYPYVWDLVDLSGKAVLLAPLQFGKSAAAEILAELRRYLAPECFEDGLDIKVLSPLLTRQDKLILPFWFALLGILVLTGFLFVDLSPRAWLGAAFSDAWKVENWLPQFESVWVYSADQAPGFWVVADGVGEYRAYHFLDGTGQSWELPRLEHDTYPEQVSGDQAGYPIVWLGDGILHYQNREWSKVAYDQPASIHWGFQDVVFGEQGWLISTDDEKRILKIDALTGKSSVQALPDAAVRKGLSPQIIRRALDGSLLVLLENETDTRVYVLDHEQWQAQSYPVTLLADSWVRDFVLDADRALWVLFEKDDQWQVEKISPGGEFLATRLPAPPETDPERLSYWRLFVDARQRLWLAGYDNADFMAVFNPGWSGDASLMQFYTKANSNYRDSIHPDPIMSADGRLWDFASSITSIDTNLQILPPPLPGWFAFLNKNSMTIFWICMLLNFLFSLWFMRRSRQFLPKPKK